jgi:hypothetical protein
VPLYTSRTVAELRELRELTDDDLGAHRVAWTDAWAVARRWMHEKLSTLSVDVEVDEAANQWATLRGRSEKAVIIGGHIDSVPDGGWLDGSLNVLAGLEVPRRLTEDTPPVTNGVRLDRMLGARRQLEGAAAYLELHIEQGPVLERLGAPRPRARRDRGQPGGGPDSHALRPESEGPQSHEGGGHEA